MLRSGVCKVLSLLICVPLLIGCGKQEVAQVEQATIKEAASDRESVVETAEVSEQETPDQTQVAEFEAFDPPVAQQAADTASQEGSDSANSEETEIPFQEDRTVTQVDRDNGSLQEASAVPPQVLTPAMAASLTKPSGDTDGSEIDSPTHRQSHTIEPTVDGKPIKMNTFCVDHDGNILAACGGKQTTMVPTENGGYEVKELNDPACVLLLDSQGKQLGKWDLDFSPTAINTSPSGDVFVGGEGKLVHLAADGKVLASGESPNMEDLEEFKAKAIEKAKAQAEMYAESFKKQIEALQKRIDKIKAVAEEDRSRIQKAQLSAFETQLKFYEDFDAMQGIQMSPEKLVAQALAITSISASDEDVFLVCASIEGSGYSIWRTNHEFSEAREILDGVSGCCGQMDIQCCDGNLVVAENGSFQVAIYDRSGTSVTSFGGRDRSSKQGFGSCCNPMNTLPTKGGVVLTAESSIGHIKRFDQEGKFLGYVGRAKVGGGCKHCALGHDPKADLYFMMHEDANKICVLGNIDSLPKQTKDEARIAKLRTEFDARLLGTWQFTVAEKEEKLKANDTEDDADEGLLADPSDFLFTKVIFKTDGTLEAEGGAYASVGYTWTWQPISASGDLLKLQVFGDQMELMVMTLDLSKPDVAQVTESLALGQTREAKRTHGCDGKPCGENCEKEKAGKDGDASDEERKKVAIK